MNLAFVLIFGHTSLGAQRWINLGIIRFQPSDLMRLAVPMILAWYFTQHEIPPHKRDILICSLIIAVPALIIAKEPDLGSAIVIALGGLVVLFFALDS